MCKHTKECVSRRKDDKQRQEDFLRKFPHFCIHCRGLGVIEYHENQAPLGSGYTWTEVFQEPCQKCLEKLICPQCATAIDDTGFDEDEFPHESICCAKCGWNSVHSLGLPTVHSCYCEGLWN